MNLTEHYILKIYSVDDITEEYERKTGRKAKEPLVIAHMKIDCYGNKLVCERIFGVSEWEKAKKQGYLLS